MKTKQYIVTVVMVAVLVLALAAFSAPAMAWTDCDCDVETGNASTCQHGTNGTVNGTIYVDGDGESELGQDYVTVDFEAIPADVNIKWARVYWHIWMPGNWSDAKFCNATQCWENNQTICDPSEECTCEQDEYDGFYGGGCGTTWVYWNVTNNVTSGELHNITIDNRAPGADGRTMWVYLVAVLENDTTYSEMHYWVNQGYEDMDTYQVNTTWFNGSATTGRNGTLWHLALCAGESEGVWFNGEKVHNGIPRDTVTKEIVTNVEGDTTQNMTWNNTGLDADPYLHPVMAIFMDKVELQQDITVTEIDVGTPRPNNAFTVYATVKNDGSDNIGNQFNVSLYVNGSYNAKNKSITGLNGGASKTVSFPGVTLPKGCHEFKVVADCDGNVSESNENNNATTVKAQVGYVIVVESDNDFNTLVAESNSGKLGAGNVTEKDGTYYIRNFTENSAIENCVGNGITIENTKAHFVINNCTIRNCTSGSGVFLHNLSTGTINGSTIQNNTAYGIELGLVPLSAEDPKFVNITNNTILENKLNGIDLIGFNCTVKNNNVTNNSVYGIYVLGNYSNITNNNITNNDGYGVKLYNSAGNYVYCNNFTDNNVLGHQAWDNGATNNNHWNTTKGNYWKDWQNNNGFPSSYEIDGGDNEDKRPKGLYDFLTGASEDKWAYEKNVLTKPPALTDNTVPDDEFDTVEYGEIEADDGTFQDSVTGGGPNAGYAAHRFKFTIAEPESKITKINVTWNGKGRHDDTGAVQGATLYIWNFTAPAGYEELGNNSDAGEVNLTGQITTNIGSYINAGTMTVLVVQKSARAGGDNSHIETDYVRVAVCATP